MTSIPPARIRTDQVFPEGKARAAARPPFYGDDFYNRVHVRPHLIDVGNMTERLVFEVELFNAFLTAVVLTDVDGIGVDGMVLSGLDPPLTILALTSAFGELEILLAGPAAIDGRQVFSFSRGPDLALRVIGTRLVTFGLAPDWSKTVKESLIYWTDVLESRDGTEQRIIMRPLPRWRLTYEVLEADLPAGLLDNLLAGWGGRSFVVPLWHRKSRLTSPVRPGDVDVPCETAGRGFGSGDLCVLWRDATRCDTLEVQAVGAHGLVTARPAGGEYGSGYCAPARLCHLVGDECGISAVASNLLEAELVFEADEPEPVEPAPLPAFLDGLGLFPYGHDFASARPRRLVRSMNTYDSGLALFSREDRRGWPVDHVSVEDVMLGGLEALEAFKGFVQSVGARAKAFWLDLNEDSLRLTRRIEAGTRLMYVADVAYGLLASGLPARRRLLLLTRKGRFTALVNSYLQTVEGDLMLELDDAWSVDLEPWEVGRLGFLVKARLDQDEFVLEHLVDDVARVSLELKGVSA